MSKVEFPLQLSKVAKRIPPVGILNPADVVVAIFSSPLTESPPVKVEVPVVVCRIVPPRVNPFVESPPVAKIRPPLQVDVAAAEISITPALSILPPEIVSPVAECNPPVPTLIPPVNVEVPALVCRILPLTKRPVVFKPSVATCKPPAQVDVAVVEISILPED